MQCDRQSQPVLTEAGRFARGTPHDYANHQAHSRTATRGSFRVAFACVPAPEVLICTLKALVDHATSLSDRAEGGEIADDMNMRGAPGPGDPFAGAVYVRRRAMGMRGELAVLEIIPEGEGRVRLSDPAGQELFSQPPSALRVGRESRTTFRVRLGDERWWLSGATFRSGRQLERVRQRIGRDDVILAAPKLPETDERAYNPLMSNLTAQQQAWCGLWIWALRQAGAQVE